MNGKNGSHVRSILQDRKECYITKSQGSLHKHHIFFGTGLRAISDKYGFWVWLIPVLHNLGDYGVHGKYGYYLDLKLKKACQNKFEENHDREDFIRLIGRNYL